MWNSQVNREDEKKRMEQVQLHTVITLLTYLMSEIQYALMRIKFDAARKIEMQNQNCNPIGGM